MWLLHLIFGLLLLILGLLIRRKKAVDLLAGSDRTQNKEALAKTAGLGLTIIGALLIIFGLLDRFKVISTWIVMWASGAVILIGCILIALKVRRV